MKRFAFLLVAAVLVFASVGLSPVPAQFQPGGKGKGGAPGSGLPTSLHYVTQQSVADDLRLSEKQGKQFADLREKWLKEAKRDAATSVAEYSQKIQTMTASSEKEVTALLDAAQQKRLKQIIFRQPLNNGRDARAFTMAIVVKELKLTDAQNAEIKSIETARRTASAQLFLTGEQSAEIATKLAAHKQETYTLLVAVLNSGQRMQLKELLGDPVQGVVNSSRGNVTSPDNPFPGNKKNEGTTPLKGGRGTVLPLYVSIQGVLVAGDSKVLHEELKLSEAQAKRLSELTGQSRSRLPKFSPANSPDEGIKLLAQMAKDNEKVLAEILDAKQRMRFTQVILQHYSSGRNASSSTISRFVEVIDGLKLTKDQQTQLRSPTEFTKVLDEKQHAKWKAMLGEPFDKVASLQQKTVGAPTPATSPLYVSIQGVLFADRKVLHEELKLSDNQAKRAVELRARSLSQTKKMGPGNFTNEREQLRAQQAKDNEKVLAEILDAKQRMRFQQVILQYYSSGATGIGGKRNPDAPTVGRFVEVVDGLKLTKDQQAQLQTAMEFTKILDAKQQAQWKAMLGEPFDKVASLQQGFGAPKKNPAGIVNTQLQYLQEKSVQEDLKLSEAQIKKLPEFSRTWQELTKDINPFAGFGVPGTDKKLTEALAEARASMEKVIAGVLNGKQVLRLDQIELQQKRGQVAFFADARVRKGLGLSEDQIKKIGEVNSDANKMTILVLNGLDVRPPTNQDDLFNKTMASFKKIAESKRDAVLTPQQHETLRAMLGVPFTGKLLLKKKGGTGPLGGGGFGGGIPQ